MIEKQRKADGEALVSTVLFDNMSEVIHDRVNIRDIKPMTDRDYTVRGCTALLDAIGGAIHHIGNIHSMPDRRMSRSIRCLSSQQTGWRMRVGFTAATGEADDRAAEAKYGWEFLFLGANIDAVETARHFGSELTEPSTTTLTVKERSSIMRY